MKKVLTMIIISALFLTACGQIKGSKYAASDTAEITSHDEIEYEMTNSLWKIMIIDDLGTIYKDSYSDINKLVQLQSFNTMGDFTPTNSNSFNFEFSDTPYDDSYYSGFSLTDKEINNSQVEDFAVNDNNEIAVATGKGINIYDKNGTFLYGYEINTMGSSYSIDFHNDTIEIYRGRPQDYICLNKNGNIINKGFIDEKNNANKIAINNISQNKGKSYRKYNGCDFELNSTMTKLIKTDEKGEQIIIYNAGTIYNVAIVSIIILIVVTAILFIVIFAKKGKSNNKQSA